MAVGAWPVSSCQGSSSACPELPRPLRALRTVYDMWRLAPLVAAAGALSVGDVAPAFSGTSFDGRTIDLSYAKQTEKGLIIWFYPRAGTGG